MKIINLPVPILIIILLSACSYPGALYVEEVQVGLDVSVSTTDTRPLNINLGYDRAMFAMTPKIAEGKDSASLLSKSDMLMQFSEETVINNIFVSGHAAANIAENKERMDALFQVCEVTPEFTEKKLAIEKKLDAIKEDNEKVKDLYKTFFPNSEEGGRLDITDNQKRTYQFGRLKNKLDLICDPEGDLATIEEFQKKLEIISPVDTTE